MKITAENCRLLAAGKTSTSEVAPTIDAYRLAPNITGLLLELVADGEQPDRLFALARRAIVSQGLVDDLTRRALPELWRRLATAAANDVRTGFLGARLDQYGAPQAAILGDLFDDLCDLEAAVLARRTVPGGDDD